MYKKVDLKNGFVGMEKEVKENNLDKAISINHELRKQNFSLKTESCLCVCL